MGQSTTGPQKKSFKALLPRIVLGALLLVIAGGVYAYYVSPYRMLQGIRMVEGPYGNRAVYAITWYGKEKVVVLPVSGLLADYVRENGRELASTVQDSTNILWDVQSATIIATSTQAISTLTVSSSGEIAYAQRVATSTAQNPSAFYSIDTWHIRLLSPGGQVQDLGIGYAPHFFKSRGTSYLFYVTPDNLVFRNLSNNNEYFIPIDKRDYSARYVPKIADNGSYLALPNPNSGYSLFGVEHQQSGFVLKPIGTTATYTHGVAFANNNILISLVHPRENIFVIRKTVLSGRFVNKEWNLEVTPHLPIITLIP